MNCISVTILLLCSLVRYILSEPVPEPGYHGGDNGIGNQWGSSSPWQSGISSFGNGFGHGGSGGGFNQNRWQRGNTGGAGNGQSFPSNSYNTPQKYGYEYTIPGADVHFAAFRGAGQNSFGRSNGYGGGNGGGHNGGYSGSSGSSGWPNKGFGGSQHGGFGGSSWPQKNFGGRGANGWQQKNVGSGNQWPQKNGGQQW